MKHELWSRRKAGEVFLAARWLAAGAGALVTLVLLALLLAWVVLRPPRQDLIQLGGFLLLSGAATLALGLAGSVANVGRLMRTVRAKLLLLPFLASVLALVNVGFLAKLMFISSHDLGVLAVLMAFSLGTSVFLALFMSASISSGLAGLVRSVRRLGAGDLQTRADATSRHSELRELAESFNAMADQLEHKMATQKEVEQARRQLVATVSHDLRTPLASMRAIVESINDGVVVDTDTVRRYMQTLQHEIEYLSKLIDDLFELSQIDSGVIRMHMEPASLKDLVSDIVQGLSAQAAEKQVAIQGVIPESMPPVVVDSRRLQRVLYNLMQNALRHTPADGTVAVTAETGPNEVLISVSDTGEGIPPEDLPIVFDRFYRTDRSRSRAHGGAGLGLAIAKGIVEAHGGRIWARSEYGRGATFTFSLPRARVA